MLDLNMLAVAEERQRDIRREAIANRLVRAVAELRTTSPEPLLPRLLVGAGWALLDWGWRLRARSRRPATVSFVDPCAQVH